MNKKSDTFDFVHKESPNSIDQVHWKNLIQINQHTDTDLLKKMVLEYLEKTPPLIENIKSKNDSSISNFVHQVSGLSANLGAFLVRDICSKIEEGLDENNDTTVLKGEFYILYQQAYSEFLEISILNKWTEEKNA